MKGIKEINEFAKMFKINIPVEEHFEYYINTLSKSPEYKDVISLVNNYSDFEVWLKENGFNNVGHYKMGTVYNLLKKHLEESNAYKRCMQFDYSHIEFYEKDNLKMHEGNFLLSLDISSANFQSMKLFDHENELKGSWVELCDSLNIHPMISSSKSFRQVVFGNLSPKRFQKIQHSNMVKLAKDLEHFDIIFVSHDEIIINLGKEGDDVMEKFSDVLEDLETIREVRINNNEPWMDLHLTRFKLNKISKGIYLKTIFRTSTFQFPGENGMDEIYKTLFGCPGNVYYMNFKKHVLCEEIEDRDCLFSLDNRLAKWVI